MIFERMVLTDRISETVEDQIQLQLAQFGDRLYKVFDAIQSTWDSE